MGGCFGTEGATSEADPRKDQETVAGGSWRWQREIEAEFAEDEDAWFQMDLIKRCIDPDLELIPEELLLMRGRQTSAESSR